MHLSRKITISFLSGAACLGLMSAAFAAGPAKAVREKEVTVMVTPGADLMKLRSGELTRMPMRTEQMSLTSERPAVRMEFDNNQGGDHWGDRDHVPLWTYHVKGAPRDGSNYLGAMVGTNPFRGKETSRVPVVIVPMIITTHEIATGFDGANMTETAGDVTQNSGAPDNNCLTAPNNVPSTLLYQSPIFQKAPFTFGGAYMGDTQYIDAFQRANFYEALGDAPGNYHVLFSPVRVVAPVTVDVPANYGLAADVPKGPNQQASANLFGTCGTVQFLDVNWFDSYINGTILPQLAREGVGPGTIPVFFLYDTNLASPVTNLDTCCILGYHSYAGEPVPRQFYAVAEMDVTNLFGSPAFENSAVLSHEMGELVDDPYGDNYTPPWGNTGQVAGCQANLEVGDPLTGNAITPVTMKNGYTYQLQELAFFSWYFGGQSLGVNGWYSNNGTFTSDAGPVCGP